jgi:pimeloyl-ACP methyl ester carboxylesterase
MGTFTTHGIDIHYELFRDRRKPPVVLLHGLGGSGKSWGSHVERFAQDFFVVLPDQRGVGQPTLVICGGSDFCTPLPNSEELAGLIPGAELTVMRGGGHVIHHEQEQPFFDTVQTLRRTPTDGFGSASSARRRVYRSWSPV